MCPSVSNLSTCLERHTIPQKKRPERHTEMTKCPKDGAAWSRPEPLAAGPRPAGGTSTWTRPLSSDTQVPTRHFHKDKVDSEPTARLTPSLSLRRPVDSRRRQRRRHRPALGAEAFVGIFAGDGHSPGIPIPSLPFLLFKTERQTLTTIWLFDAYYLRTF